MACKGSGVRIPLAPFIEPLLTGLSSGEGFAFWVLLHRTPHPGGARIKILYRSRPYMSDRTQEQIDQTLDRLLEVAAANTSNIAENSRAIGELRATVATVAGAVETLARLTDQRLNRQDQIISMLSSYITGVSPANEEPS
jgi:hypothetical protein